MFLPPAAGPCLLRPPLQLGCSLRGCLGCKDSLWSLRRPICSASLGLRLWQLTVTHHLNILNMVTPTSSSWDMQLVEANLSALPRQRGAVPFGAGSGLRGAGTSGSAGTRGGGSVALPRTQHYLTCCGPAEQCESECFIAEASRNARSTSLAGLDFGMSAPTEPLSCASLATRLQQNPTPPSPPSLLGRKRQCVVPPHRRKDGAQDLAKTAATSATFIKRPTIEVPLQEAAGQSPSTTARDRRGDRLLELAKKPMRHLRRACYQNLQASLQSPGDALKSKAALMRACA